MKQIIKYGGYATVLYILQYIYLLYNATSCEYEYNVGDSIYFVVAALINFILLFVLWANLQPLHPLDRLVFGVGVAIAATRLLNELLDLFQIVHVGDARIIGGELVLIFILNALKKIIYG